MSQVSVSTKYQIVIQKEVRQIYGIKPGNKMTFIASGKIIYLVPPRPFGSLKGIVKGVNLLEGYRDKSDRP